MKIGHGHDAAPVAPLNTGSAAETAARSATAAAPAPGAAAESSAKVELSSHVKTLRGDDAGAAFDAEKVARISQQIADGTFKINPEAIADKLIANAQEVLAKAQR